MLANGACQPSTHEVFGRQLASLVRPRIGAKETVSNAERSTPVITGLITVVSPPYTDIRKALLLDIFYRMRQQSQESAASPSSRLNRHQSFHFSVIDVSSNYGVLAGCRAKNLVIHFYQSEIQPRNAQVK